MIKDLIGKTIQLWPGDTYSKSGIIKDVDDFGWLIEITKAAPSSDYEVGSEYYINHSRPLVFKILPQ